MFSKGAPSSRAIASTASATSQGTSSATPQLERACRGVVDYMGAENILYINVANRLSVDCDCDSHPAEPEMDDLGIFASLDPVALDKACYDAVKNSPDEGKAALIERMDSRHAIHTVEAAEKLGLGTTDYELIEL